MLQSLLAPAPYAIQHFPTQPPTLSALAGRNSLSTSRGLSLPVRLSPAPCRRSLPLHLRSQGRDRLSAQQPFLALFPSSCAACPQLHLVFLASLALSLVHVLKIFRCTHKIRAKSVVLIDLSLAARMPAFALNVRGLFHRFA